jgi:hypothetical protein
MQVRFDQPAENMMMISEDQQDDGLSCTLVSVLEVGDGSFHPRGVGFDFSLRRKNHYIPPNSWVACFQVGCLCLERRRDLNTPATRDLTSPERCTLK